LGLVGAVAWAADEKTPSADKQAKIAQKHPEADANKDGTVTSDEWRQYRDSKKAAGQGAGKPADAGKHGGRTPDPAKLLAAHPELDTNKDGVLSEDEMKAGREMRMHGGPGMDGGPAGVVDMMLARFEKIDTDGNGQLSKEELAAFKAKLIERGPAGGFGGRPGGPGAEGHGQRGDFAASVLQKYPAADTDKDGKLSPEEMKAFQEGTPDAMRQMFLEKHPDADSNKDGQLSDEEFKAAREKMRGEWRSKRPGAQGGTPASK
jgi:Ca2+-binding EF-hand superfamily protein